ncbi:Solute carrier family 12 member 8 [Acipenser ruthenus]|uniref:Solute carrier family 12 member 8 n=1 Tax=Acipenser ruthenus TaxID=7906 RepID=A0A444U6H8_ACIRT|nr:Solute carrier family 12 member 8 [Acipenser ruthenus]
MINIFGVVLFLRTGWLVGNTGVLLGMLLVSLVVVVALVTVFSGLGVCERCQVGSGGVYSMISTVLGGRVGGTVGLLYVFGQCVAGAMYITGFAESIAEVLNLSNIWAVRGISMGVLLGLLGINLAGVKWIIRLQLLLLAVLAVSALDFVVGTFSHLDPVHGFVGYSEELLSNNTLPDYTPGESFFSVFGVFFPAATGKPELSTDNCGERTAATKRARCDGRVQHEWRPPEAGDQHPSGVLGCHRYLPSGNLSVIQTIVCCKAEPERSSVRIRYKAEQERSSVRIRYKAEQERSSVRIRYKAEPERSSVRIRYKAEQERSSVRICYKAEQEHSEIAGMVSLVGFLFLLGLYISSLASCMGGLYGAPRILQCIAQEKVIPILGVLGQGRGPNKTPVAAICLTSLITMAFIFIGQVNVLASIVTINFMLTYSTIDYSYFCVSMSYDLQMKQRRPLPKEESRTRNPSKPLIFGRHSDYGTDGMAKNRRNGTLLEFTKDMDQIFQTVDPDMENKEREREKKEKESKSWRTRKPAKQTLMDSFRLDLKRSAASVKECAKTSDTESVNCSEAGATANSAQEEQDLMAQAFDSQEQQLVSVVLESDPRNDKAESAFQRQSSRDRDDSQEDFTAEQSLQGTEIQEKPISFYSRLCNHWVSLVGAISSLMIMFVIQWIYAFVNIGMAILLYFYIGKVSPGLPPGVAAHFSFFKWIQSSLKNIGRRGPSPQKQIVMTPSFATVGMETTQLTEENADFASRDRYHHSSIISAEELNHPLH